MALGQSAGQFSGNAQIELLGGRKAKLLRDFSYRDPANRLWRARKDYVSDGASIPEILWSLEGGPWAGSYRDAAIIHDFYCEDMSRSWEDTHDVFYDAMRSRGISEWEATRKHWAVYYLGPRWDATHRWTSVFGIGKRRRDDDSPGPRMTQSQALAVRIAEQRFFNLQAVEFASANNRLLAVGPDAFIVEEEPPRATFDFAAEVEQAEMRVDELATINDEGQVLVPPAELIFDRSEILTAPELSAEPMIGPGEL